MLSGMVCNKSDNMGKALQRVSGISDRQGKQYALESGKSHHHDIAGIQGIFEQLSILLWYL